MLEIGGYKSSEIMAAPRKPSMLNIEIDLKQLNSGVEDEDGFIDLGAQNCYKPSISDLQLLQGTKQWELVKHYEGIDENTVDPNKKDEVEEKKEQGDEDMQKPTIVVQQSDKSSIEKDSTDMLHGIHKYVLQSLI